MPSSPTEARFRRTSGAARCALALVIVALGWTHGVLYVEGGSMEPALSAGDLIVYRRAGVVCQRGDLVVFEHDGALVVHRIAGVMRSGALRTRGDANEAIDTDVVEARSVRGEVVATVRSGRVATRLAGLLD